MKPWFLLALSGLIGAGPAQASLLQRFSPSFPMGEALAEARVGLDGRGNLVLAWMSLQGECRFRRFHASGRELGTATVVPAASGAIRLALAVAPRGAFALSYVRPGAALALEQGWILFDAGGGEVASGTLAGGTLDELRAAADDAGRIGFALSARVPFQPVLLRVIDRQGGSVLAERVVTDQGFAADVLPQAEGVFLVTWYALIGPYMVRHAQRIDSQGLALGPVFHPPGSLLAADGSGRLAAAGVGDGAWLQRLSPEGLPLGSRITVETRRVAALVGLTCDGPGNCVLAYRLTEPDAGSQSWARRYAATGAADGPAFPIGFGLPDGLTGVVGGRGGQVLMTYTSHLPFAPLSGVVWSVPAKGDFDADLRADLALRDLVRGQTRVWTMVEGVRTSNPLVWPPTPDADWSLVGVDDFDGDRRQDLLFRRYDGELRFVFLGGAGHEALADGLLLGARPPGPAWLAEAAGDFDGDGWADVFWRQALTGELRLMRLHGSRFASWLEVAGGQAPAGAWRVAAARDFDGDGRLDLLWSEAGTGRLVQWLLDEELRLVGARDLDPPVPASPDWRVVAAGDYGVGPGGVEFSQDIVWRHAVSGRQVIWYLDRDGLRTAGVFTAPAAPGDATGWAIEGPR